MQFKYGKYKFIVLILLSTVLLFVAEYAFARAGGGGGFGGGGGGGGGGFGGGGGSGGGDGLFLLIMLAFRYPVIGVPLLIIFIVFSVLSSYKGRSAYVSRTIRKAYTKQDARSTAKAEAALLERDSHFSKEALAERTKLAFTKIQDAWATQNMVPVRSLISDGVFERFSLQLDMMKASMIRNDVSDITVQSIQVVAIESDKFFDTVHLSVTASAVDRFVHIETGKRLSGSSQSETFTEYWSLLRRPGATTLGKPGLMEGFCPNCGTPVSASDTAECFSCKALLNSGEYDWVLAEITQASEWNFSPRQSIAGLNEMEQKDSGFNIQHIEDRVSVMFYRNIAAEFFADRKYIVKLASDNFISDHRKNYRVLDNGRHKFFADAAVGTVELESLELSDVADGMDRAHVKVRWSGHRVEKKVPSLIKPDFDSSRIYTYEFLLERGSAVKSSDKNILTSSHCPGCGAPEVKSDRASCEYCKTPLNDGSKDWVLTKIEPYTPHHKQRITPTTFCLTGEDDFSCVIAGAPRLSKFDNESILACCIGIMLADGVIDPKERELLQQLSQAKGISDDRLQMLIASVSDGSLAIPEPKDMITATEFLRCMVLMCLIDGKVTSSEYDLLKQLSSRMGYSDIDIKLMIKKERMQLYKKAQQATK